MSVFRQFLKRIKSKGQARKGSVRILSMGKERMFDAFDLDGDTFVLERGLLANLSRHPSVLMVEKGRLKHGQKGWVMTISTGNHAVAAIPLLDGRFWGLSALVALNKSEAMLHSVVCANIVNDALEISQREIPHNTLVQCDKWLLDQVGFGMSDVVMTERNEQTLEYYRELGQEWRVKPLAWTENEMRVALLASKKKISTKLTYYHSTRGVHFITYPEFSTFSEMAETNPEEYLRGIREIAGVYEGSAESFARTHKYRGHHEIEFFGLQHGNALEYLVPGLEELLSDVDNHRIGQLGVIQKAQELVALYESLLSNHNLANESTQLFVESLYMCITGEVYLGMGDGVTPAFDDRRTALPGATFVNGRQVLHPGADQRTEVLLANLRGFMSRDELIEYANVYELRAEDEKVKLGSGSTREVVYKTNRRPLESSLVEKRVFSSSKGYSSYVLARIGAMRALGVKLSDFYIVLKRRPGADKGQHDHYIRRRCEGEPMEAVPANYFRSLDGSGEDRDVVLSLAALMGDAAAQNLAMKKYDPSSKTPRYDIGKEIYAFEHDVVKGKMMPKSVSTCSVRGSFGWPILDESDANLREMYEFYFDSYAKSLLKYWHKHHSVSIEELEDSFFGGFEHRTKAMGWNLSSERDKYESFSPDIPSRYGFVKKWRFMMWALGKQEQDLASLRKILRFKIEENLS